MSSTCHAQLYEGYWRTSRYASICKGKLVRQAHFANQIPCILITYIRSRLFFSLSFTNCESFSLFMYAAKYTMYVHTFCGHLLVHSARLDNGFKFFFVRVLHIWWNENLVHMATDYSILITGRNCTVINNFMLNRGLLKIIMPQSEKKTPFPPYRCKFTNNGK